MNNSLVSLRRPLVALLALAALPMAGGCTTTGSTSSSNAAPSVAEPAATAAPAATASAAPQLAPLPGVRDVVVVVDVDGREAGPLDRVAADAVGEFLTRRGFCVRDDRALRRAVEEFRRQEDGMTSPQGRIEVGRQLNIQAYVFVSVDDVAEEVGSYSTVTVFGFSAGANPYRTRASLRFTMTETETARVLWSGRVDGSHPGQAPATAVRALSEKLMAEEFRHVPGTPTNVAMR